MNKPKNTVIATGVIALLVMLCALAWYKTETNHRRLQHMVKLSKKKLLSQVMKKVHMVDAYIVMETFRQR
jgi:hypothetical protein